RLILECEMTVEPFAKSRLPRFLDRVRRRDPQMADMWHAAATHSQPADQVGVETMRMQNVDFALSQAATQLSGRPPQDNRTVVLARVIDDLIRVGTDRRIMTVSQCPKTDIDGRCLGQCLHKV